MNFEDKFKEEQTKIKAWLTTPLTRFTTAGYPNLWEVAGYNAYCLDVDKRIKEGCSWNKVKEVLEEQGKGNWRDQVDRVYLPKINSKNEIIGYELVFDAVDTSGNSLGMIVERYSK